MQLKVYINQHLVETIEVEGPGYHPQPILEQIAKDHAVNMGDEIKIIPFE